MTSLIPGFEHPSFDWNSKDTYQEYVRFKQHIDFVFKGPLAASGDPEKAGWLGMWLGKEGREIYKTFTWAEGESENNPAVVLAKIEAYVKPKKNKRTARHRLNCRKQRESETFDNYIKDLKLCIMDCDYTNPDDILVDVIIAGVREIKIQERLLDQGEKLTLSKTVEIGRQYEASQLQLKLLREDKKTEVGLSSIKSRSHKPNDNKMKNQSSRYRSSNASKPDNTNHKSTYKRNKSLKTKRQKCPACGIKYREKHRCPAIGTICNYCKCPDHWIEMCRKRHKSINAIEDENSDSETDSSDSDDESVDIHTIETTCIDSIDTKSYHQDKWSVTLTVDESPVKFRVDTGSKCCVITKETFKNSKFSGPKRESKVTLKSYSNHKIKPEFTIKLPVTYKENKLEANFEIADIEQENILSGDLAEELGLIQRIYSLDTELGTDQMSIMEQFEEFPDLIKTTGTLPGEHSLIIDPEAKGVIHAVRKQPASLKPKIKETLLEMEENGYIRRVKQPTEWVSSMVVSLRKGKVRICIDPKDLNRALKREHHPMKTVEEVISDIPDGKIFSVLDAKQGFLQIKLDEASSYLTTFNTPIGRFRWLRLPFGIKSSPEIYQRIMDEMLEGITGVAVIMDDILIAGRDIEHHDKILKKVFRRATKYNLRLNFTKCRIRQTEVPYVGHIVTANGLKPDMSKVRAITEMKPPQDKEGVRRILGLVQYLAKFIPNLSQVDAPLRTLLKSDIEFRWEHEQEASFNKLKELCTTSPVLGFYDVNKPVEIQCDSSKDGLGAVLIQNNRPIAYSSRSLTQTEQRYAQIEKELLSVVHACVKFHCYIFGKHVTVYNDHKPLEQIFKKPLLAAPMRLQRMLMRLQWYDITLKYMRGKDLTVADALSRAYLPDSQPEMNLEQINSLDMITISNERSSELAACTKKELQTLLRTILNGWPDTRSETPLDIRQYWDSKDQLSISDGIIFKGLRILIPPSLRQKMLYIVHESHLGIVKCKQRAREVFYWPGINAQVEEMVQNCPQCAEYQNKQSAEPLKPTVTPDLPYSEVGSDLFEFQGKKYLIVVDYYSRYPDVVELQTTTSSAVIDAMKTIFSCHGIPQLLRSDNGPQYTSEEFKTFCRTYGIQHKTSSPHFQSSNGEAERAIQTIKRMWRKSSDKHLALLNYRTTPLSGVSYSPSQLLMGRRPRNTLPTTKAALKPMLIDERNLQKQFKKEKDRQKTYYDIKKGVQELEPLEKSTPVRIQPTEGKTWKPATVVTRDSNPRSYIVESNYKLYRRNRKHLRKSTTKANVDFDDDMPEWDNDTGQNSESPHIVKTAPVPKPTTPETVRQTHNGTDRQPYKSRSGRTVKCPIKLDL